MSHTPMCGLQPVAAFAIAPTPGKQKLVAAGSGVDSGLVGLVKGATVFVQAAAPATLVFYQGRTASTRQASIVNVNTGCTPIRLEESFDACEITSSAASAVHVTRGGMWLGGSGE